MTNRRWPPSRTGGGSSPRKPGGTGRARERVAATIRDGIKGPSQGQGHTDGRDCLMCLVSGCHEVRREQGWRQSVWPVPVHIDYGAIPLVLVLVVTPQTLSHRVGRGLAPAARPSSPSLLVWFAAIAPIAIHTRINISPQSPASNNEVVIRHSAVGWTIMAARDPTPALTARLRCTRLGIGIGRTVFSRSPDSSPDLPCAFDCLLPHIFSTSQPRRRRPPARRPYGWRGSTLHRPRKRRKKQQQQAEM